MKNIRFYEAEKYNSDDYEKVEDMIYKTIDKKSYGEYLSLEGCSDTELVSKLLKTDEWVQGTGDLFTEYLILTYDGKRYYREIDNVGTDDDMVFTVIHDPSEQNIIYVTSIIYEPEPELEENEPSESFISQYPLEDILDEFFVYCEDMYEKENESDKNHSYVEFASEKIDDIKKLLSIIGKHVYNKLEGEYVYLKIE